RRRHLGHCLDHLARDHPPRRTGAPSLSLTRRAIPTPRRDTHELQHLRLPCSGRRHLGPEFGGNHLATLHAQTDWPESFFKMRLAIVYSPITWSRFSICCSSSAIRRSRASLFPFPF